MRIPLSAKPSLDGSLMMKRSSNEQELFGQIDDQFGIGKMALTSDGSIAEWRINTEGSMPYIEVKRNGKWRKVTGG